MSGIVRIVVQDEDVAVVNEARSLVLEAVLPQRYSVTLKTASQGELYGFEAVFSAGALQVVHPKTHRELGSSLVEDLQQVGPQRLVITS